MEKALFWEFRTCTGLVSIPKGSDGQPDAKVPGQRGVLKGEGEKGQLGLKNYATKAERTAGLGFKKDTKVQRPAETKFTARSGWLKRLISAPALGQPARVGMPKAGSGCRR
ncbi:hypothetical protein CYMTET_54626 [Cymbomonas tetramitiformis]|uniref:Uncharacterized protein n=1 Tax=Cymbomonas tetramitiformis TaxID=36881 RepID=A0AAE0EPE2_9CHLO|nr:hypothetical protein CYMTET_54626 [Cymbomonas tetramitiformis]